MAFPCSRKNQIENVIVIMLLAIIRFHLEQQLNFQSLYRKKINRNIKDYYIKVKQ